MGAAALVLGIISIVLSFFSAAFIPGILGIISELSAWYLVLLQERRAETQVLLRQVLYFQL